LKPATKGGGETILVDGFAVAEQIRSQNVADFDLLTTAPIEHHYVEGGSSPSNAKIYSRCCNKPVIEIDREGMLKQIRYNPYDRAPMRITSTDDIIKFYKAYERLSKLVHDTKNQLEISLKPGNVIFIDNFRVLHARKAFQVG
uniref:Trimethyllysine dioxygenase, mitochondrial (inferred by orthology to a human protein) n=1 Tax=Anisakis simplex TaxID=6269 RepID=A0A0M3JAT1_ANISI